MLLLALFVCVDAMPRLDNNTRLVHRRAHASSEDGDTIGCAEKDAMFFEHVLTPAMLWCNTTHCQPRLGATLEVHSIDCNAQRCHVQVHCEERFGDLKQAIVFTVIVIGLFVGFLIAVNPYAPPRKRYMTKLL